MGKVLSDCGRHADAIVCYRRALQLSPESYQVYNNLGILLQFRDELDEAIFCYHKSVEIKSDYAAAHYNMGNALTAQGKLDEAIACRIKRYSYCICRSSKNYLQWLKKDYYEKLNLRLNQIYKS